MNVRAYAATALLASASWLAIGVSTPALALCDAYSGGCPSAPPTGGGGGGGGIGGDTEQPATGGGTEQPTGGGGTEQPTGGGQDIGGGDTDGATGGDTDATGGGNQAPGMQSNSVVPATLPFTGGELVLMTAIGVGALAGGTALVLAGRRRAHAA